MNLGQRGINLIKKYEGCRLEAYLCPGNVWTIGWGHTATVKPGMKITQDEADRLFLQDIKRYSEAVNQYQWKFNFNQNQFDALTSFAYNCGIGALANVMNCCSTKEEIAAECKLYNKGAGVILPGLVKRREEEYQLFMEECVNVEAGKNEGISYPEIGVYHFEETVKIRNAISLDNSTFVGLCYEPGETVNYHTVHLNKCGYNWIQYTRSNGEEGYCAITNRETGENHGYAV